MQRAIESYKRELETLKSYAQVMKDASETDKQDAERFHADLKKATLGVGRERAPPYRKQRTM